MPSTEQTTLHAVSPAAAGVRLRMSRERVIRHVQMGRLEGWQDEGGRWHVSVASVNALLEQRTASATAA